MKAYVIKNRVFLISLLAGGLVMLAGRVGAQTFRVLHDFSGGSDGANSGGGLIANPLANTLYGTTTHGGSFTSGTVFKMNLDGTSFSTLHSFMMFPIANSDGGRPYGGLILSGNAFYGSTVAGGTSDSGALFAIGTDGTGFTTLHSFTALDASPPHTNSDGAWPFSELVVSSNILYGTTLYGGTWGNGEVFAINTDGTGFLTLYSFSGSTNNPSGIYTNSGGGNPFAGMILSGDTLYGTAALGGSFGGGTVFKVRTDGKSFGTLHDFGNSTDGFRPDAGLILSGNTLYGTATFGGSSGNGTVFAINTDGTSFRTLYSFTATSGSPYYTNSDGANPTSGLLLSGNTLYGTARSGGRSGNGTVFAVNTDGRGFTTLYSFGATSTNSGVYTNSDGANPNARLLLLGSTLYGATVSGGGSGNGIVFNLSFAPQPNITSSGRDVILTWPTNYAGFDYTGYTLQAATNLASPDWTTNVPAPVVINGQYTVTNPISGIQQFYRLSQSPVSAQTKTETKEK